MIKFTLNQDFFVWREIPYEEYLFLENVINYEIGADYYPTVIVAGDEIQRLTISDVVNEGKTIYVVAGTGSEENFGHFFWETVINIKSFLQVKKKFPKVIFLVQHDKIHVKKIFDYYGITYSTTIKNHNNYVGFLPPATPLITNTNILLYGEMLERFHYELHRENKSVTSKKIEILYLPRHKSGNYPYENMRSVEADAIEKFVSNQPNCQIFDTESNSDWGLEIETIKSAKFIIVPDGSAFAVAGFHAHNSTIIVLGSMISPRGVLKFDKAKQINKLIAKTNKVFFVSSETQQNNTESYNIENILPILQRKIVIL